MAASVSPATRALSLEDIGTYLREHLEDDILDVTIAFGLLTVDVAAHALQRAARLCKSDPKLRFDFYDHSAGVDFGEQGFAVVTHLYSTVHHHHIGLRVLCPGGRENPVAPTLTGVYRGANWHEREAYDMFGIVFEGHPGLLPRLLTVENFEGWPLRKDFLLSTREAKPWPGAKEPEERSEDTAEGHRAATLPSAEPTSAQEKSRDAAAAGAKAEAAEATVQREEVEYDQAVYDQLIAEGKSDRIARAKAKAAAMRKRGTEGADAAKTRAAGGEREEVTPEGAAEVAVDDLSDPTPQKDAAAGTVGGDVAAGAPGDVRGSDEPVDDAAAEARLGAGAPARPGGTPGIEEEGRHTGGLDQTRGKPASETAGLTAAPEKPAARGQGGDYPNTTPAPGPESDERPVDSEASTTPEALEHERPVEPEHSTQDVAMPSDAPAAEPANRPTETPLHNEQRDPASSSGTDATDRGGPDYRAEADDSDKGGPQQ